MSYRTAPVLAVFLLACGPDTVAGGDGETGETGETGEPDEPDPLYLLTEGDNTVWVVDVSNPGTVELAQIVDTSQESLVEAVASPSSRWAALVTLAFGNQSSSVWLHDFVSAPLEPAVELTGTSTGIPGAWFAQDESGLMIATRTSLDEQQLVYVPLDDQGPGSPIEVPNVSGYLYDAAFAGGSHFIARIPTAGTQELYVIAIVDGQPQAPVRVAEFDGTLTNAKWHASGESLIYDTIDSQSGTGRLHRVDLSGWPDPVVETLGPYDWTGTGQHWWASRDGARLILGHEPLQVAAIDDGIGPLEILPEATDFLALSDDGRFGLVQGAAESEEVHQLLVFDFESANPLEPHPLGTTRASIYDIAFGGGWAVWTTGDCAAAGVNLLGELDQAVELADADQFRGFAIAPARLYWKGVTFEEPFDPELPPAELSFRELDGDSPGPSMLLAHPLDEGYEVRDLVASPVDHRHFYEVSDENYVDAVLWEHDPSSGVRTAIGELGGQWVDSLWAPGIGATRPVVLRLGPSCSN